MRIEQLLRLYPRAWQARYGDEFAGLLGRRRLTFQQTIDVVAGAIDAWISPSVRAAARGSAAATAGKGATMIQQLKWKCTATQPRYTKKDALISAGVLLLASFVFTAAGIWASRRGYDSLGDALKSVSFPFAVLISMPFAITKGQSWKVQAIVLIPTMLLIALATFIAMQI